MLICRHDLFLRKRVRALAFWDKVLDPLAGNDAQLCRASRVREKGNRVPRLRRLLARNIVVAKHDAVDGAAKEAVGPVREHVANVDEDGRAGVILGARRTYGDGRPGVVAQLHLKTGLALEAEEEGDGAVVGVGSRADVGIRVGGRVGRWVAKETEDAGCCVVLGDLVRGREEVANLGAVLVLGNGSRWLMSGAYAEALAEEEEKLDA